MEDEGIVGVSEDSIHDQKSKEDLERSTIRLCETQEVPTFPSIVSASSTDIESDLKRRRKKIDELESKGGTIENEDIFESSQDSADDQDSLDHSTMSIMDLHSSQVLSKSTVFTSSTGTESDWAQPFPVLTPQTPATALQRQPIRIIPGDSLMKRMMRVNTPQATYSGRVAEVGLGGMDQALALVASVC